MKIMMMNVSKGVFTLLILAALTACSDSRIEGSWVEPVPGMPDKEFGFTLEKGGKASSINMATCKYEKWEKKGDRLIMSGLSIGNRQTLSFSDTLIIRELTAEKLVLESGELTLTYRRQK